MKRIITALAVLFAVSVSAQELNVGSINIRQGRSLRPDQELPKKGDYSKFNGWDHRRDQLCDLMNLEAFDVFGVQEARIGQIEDILERMPDYKYIGVGRDDGDRKGEHCAIFYRYKQYKVWSRVPSGCPRLRRRYRMAGARSTAVSALGACSTIRRPRRSSTC